MIIDDSTIAHGVWKRLKDIFHDNKHARVIQLDDEIDNMAIGNLFVNDYFQELKSKANRLANLGSKVSDESLFTYAINGARSKFSEVSRIIRHWEKLPTFDETRSMILLEEQDWLNQQQEPTWNMDIEASSHLADNTGMLTYFSNQSLYKSVFIGNGQSIPMTNTGHSLLHMPQKPLHLHHVLVTPNSIKNLISVRKFTHDNDVSVEFDAYGFSVKDYQTRQLLLCSDSIGDLYYVTQQPSSTNAFALLTLSPTMCHKRLGHPGEDVLRCLESGHFISCNKSNLSALCHACQLGISSAS
ncbi:ribonuclease H-like domain-containing protein [Tanacetum coccineum]